MRGKGCMCIYIVMGVTMSKSEPSSTASYKEHSTKKTDTWTAENTQSPLENGVATVIPKPLGEDAEMMELLCPIDDDDIDEQEWKGIYQRLKTDHSEDLHQLAKNGSEVTHSGGEQRNISHGPIFTSSVVERPTRITSANFSPHAPMSDGKPSRLEVIRQNIDISDKEEHIQHRKSESKRRVELIPEKDDKSLTSEFGHVEESMRESFSFLLTQPPDGEENHVEFVKGDTSSSQSNSPNPKHLSADKPDTGTGTAPTSTTIPITQVQNVPSSRQSLEIYRTSSFGSEERYKRPASSYDPFEGIDFPRSRVSSIGSGSVFSVNEVEDRLYKDYSMEIRRNMMNYGYFDKFPSPLVIRDAQRTYKRLNLPRPVDADGHVLPHPLRTSKNSTVGSRSFTDVDQHALNAPEDLLQGPLSEVISYLSMVPLDDYIARLRGFYVWLAARQLERMADGKKRQRDYKDTSPILDSLDTPEGVCRIFRRMCRYGRIKSKMIHGIIRDFSYCPGEDLDKCRGVWVSVLVEDSWWLVDPVVRPFDVRQMFKQGDSQSRPEGNYAPSFADISLFEDPENFIFSHFPDDEHWQLLARCVLREELSDLAVLRPGFFKLRMRLLTYHKAVIVVDGEDTTVSLGFPDNAPRQFSCRLRFCSNTGLDQDILLARNARVSLNRFTFLETLLNNSKMNVRIKFPKKGSYILDIFGSTEKNKADIEMLCTYRLVYENQTTSPPFPNSSRDEWGPGLTALLLGICPLSHKQGEIFVYSSLVQVRFKDQKGLQFRYDLIKDEKPVENIGERIQFLRDTDEIIFVINLQTPGFYCLKLHARSDTSKPFTNFCNYLMKKMKVIDPSGMDGSKTNIQNKKYNYKFNELESSSSTSLYGKERPLPAVADDTGHMKITLSSTGICQAIVDMRLKDIQEINFSEHTRHWRENDDIHVEVNFPRKGIYSLKILGRSKDTNHFKDLYSEMIQVEIPSEKWSPFPKALNDWKYDFKLITPLNFHIEAKINQTFTAWLPGAQDVAILGTNGWNHLSGNEGMWSGEVMTGLKNTTCKLVARFEKGSEKFSELLLFKIMTEDQLDSLDDRQEDTREAALATRKREQKAPEK